MKAIVFGATGMVGQGVVHVCLENPVVTELLLVGRRPSGVKHPKVREADFAGASYEGCDACFFCLGVSSAGMSEADYTKVTYDLTMEVARRMPRTVTFIYVSGAGTGGGSMWARVKKRTEDELLALFAKAYMFRPGYIEPLHGITSRTRLYRALYPFIRPFNPLLRRLESVTDTDRVGQAMINVALRGWRTRVLDARDINEAARPTA
ncbi:MAG: epimerase [Myxococcales bacterium]|nr:epimerase [Myxococcales bacterium]